MNNDEPEMAADVDELGAIVEQWSAAMNESRFDDALSITDRIFQFVVEHPPEETPSDILQTQVEQAEQRGDWDAAERLYHEKLSLEVPRMQTARTHLRLSRLYRFLGQAEKAVEHGRKGFELCRGDEMEIDLIMASVTFSRLASGIAPAAEIELALRSSLANLPVGATNIHFRARALVELAEARRLQGDTAEAADIVDQTFQVIEPQAALHSSSGYQGTISRAWRVRALTSLDLGDKQAAALAWRHAIDCDSCGRRCFPDQSPIDADEHSRYLYSAVEGLREAGDVDVANQFHDECRRIRDQWGLPALEVAGAFPRV